MDDWMPVRGEKPARIASSYRSFGIMPMITKKLRLVFYLLAAVELVLISVAWGRLSVH
jgi:hypothetical protein